MPRPPPPPLDLHQSRSVEPVHIIYEAPVDFPIMDEPSDCFEAYCSGCRSIALKVYRALRLSGCTDPDAFQSAVHVVELRHPGHERGRYVAEVATWIAAETEL